MEIASAVGRIMTNRHITPSAGNFASGNAAYAATALLENAYWPNSGLDCGKPDGETSRAWHVKFFFKGQVLGNESTFARELREAEA